jgi:hypothetical protein
VTAAIQPAPTAGYSSTHATYAGLGWEAIPVVGKGEPVAGATGYEGTVTPDKRAAWSALPKWANANTAIRHENTVAVDVDDPAALQELEARFGQLPVTYSSTARGADSPRRQYFFTLPEAIPEGCRIDSTPVSGVEIPWRAHRFSVVAPSIHPSGSTYAWYDPDGEPCQPPAVADLEVLPEEWFRGLVIPRTSASTDVPDDLVRYWIDTNGGPIVPGSALAIALDSLPPHGDAAWSEANLLGLANTVVRAVLGCTGGAAAREAFIDRYAAGE